MTNNKYTITVEQNPTAGYDAYWGMYDLDNIVGHGKTKIDAMSELMEQTLSASSPNDEIEIGLQA